MSARGAAVGPGQSATAGAAVPPAPADALPTLGSFRREDVTMLLKDISGEVTELPVDARERGIQDGGSHYSETLPVEYRPTPEYIALYEALVHAHAAEVAALVATLAERVLEYRGEQVVLVSLARSGTPAGVLLRRWLHWAHGIDVPHYSVSIIRDRGLDGNALRWLIAHHGADHLQFIDAWTGKGVISRELSRACGDHPGVDPTLGVLGDPGWCTPLFATRQDVLIPSACLNATICGLLSRTVLNPRLIGPGEFHGVKWYRELASEDRTAHFLDAVTAQFPAVQNGVQARVAAARAESATLAPDWRGWDTVEAIRADHGLPHVNLVKPGVGEATRVLLRRVPRLLLVTPGASGLEHVMQLAAERGVPVRERTGMSYRCVALIEPAA